MTTRGPKPRLWKFKSFSYYIKDSGDPQYVFGFESLITKEVLDQYRCWFERLSRTALVNSRIALSADSKRFDALHSPLTSFSTAVLLFLLKELLAQWHILPETLAGKIFNGTILAVTFIFVLGLIGDAIKRSHIEAMLSVIEECLASEVQVEDLHRIEALGALRDKGYIDEFEFSKFKRSVFNEPPSDTSKEVASSIEANTK